MDRKQHIRRELLRAAATAALLPLAPDTAFGQAQSTMSIKRIPPRQAGQIHNNRLGDSHGLLNTNRAIGRIGLRLLIDYLVKRGVISKDDAVLLKELVDILSRPTPINDLLRAIDDFYKKVTDKVGEVAIAVADIAKSSVEYVKEKFPDISSQQVLIIVSSDLAGALTGAATGMNLGGKVGAVIGAVIGAASASINAALDGKK